MFHAVKFIMVFSGKDRNNAGRDLRDLPDETFLSTNFVDRKLPGKGCGHTKLVSFEHAIQLIMVLPGKVAKETRMAFAGVIHRFLAGDKSLIKEIEANAESSSPIAELARATLPKPAPEDPEARRKRIMREDLDLISLQEDIQDKRMRRIEYSMQLLDRLNPTWHKSDARFRMQTEDMVKNILTVPVTTASLLTNGEPSKQQATLTISQLAQELGCKKLLHSQLCSAGSRAARLFRTRYGQEPTKHRQWVDGAERDINTYTEADRPLLTQVLVDMCLVPGSASSVASSDA